MQCIGLQIRIIVPALPSMFPIRSKPQHTSTAPPLPHDNTQMHLPPARFAEIGAELAQNSPGLSVLSENRSFRSLFGVTPYVCSVLWDLLRTNMPQASRPIHLLWALLFPKVYGSETTHRTIARVDAKTFRKWSWYFVRLLADLDLVRFTVTHSRLLLRLQDA